VPIAKQLDRKVLVLPSAFSSCLVAISNPPKAGR
jgi:hypothetical protein